MDNQSFTQNQNFNFNGENSEQPSMPNNYLILSIIAIVLGIIGNLFCCINLILGIIALVFSLQVTSKYNMGDYIGAQKSANIAKILSIISIALGIIGFVLNIVMITRIGFDGYVNQIQSILS